MADETAVSQPVACSQETKECKSVDKPKPKKMALGPLCFVGDCFNYKKRHKPGTTFHKFPNKEKFPERYKKWVKACRRADAKPTIYSLVCSNHFTEDQIDRTGQIVRLRENAVPNIVGQSHLLKKEVKPRTTTTSIKALQPIPTVQNPPVVVKTEYIQKEHEYTCSPATLKKKVCWLQNQLEIAHKRVKNSLKRERTAKSKCLYYSRELLRQKSVNKDLRNRLDAYENAAIPIATFML